MITERILNLKLQRLVPKCKLIHVSKLIITVRVVAIATNAATAPIASSTTDGALELFISDTFTYF
jgi:hypothetical protein